MDPTRRILIVDHEPKAGLDMERALTAAGHEVTQTDSGKEGLRLARETLPHLIVVDLALTDISGIDLVKLVRHEDSLERSYVVLLVREEVPSAIQARGLESGADAVVQRTVLTRDFVSRIEALLRRQRTQDELWQSVRDFRKTFDAISDMVYLVDVEHRIIECNQALVNELGIPRGEIIGAKCFELMHRMPKPILGCLGERVTYTHRRETWEAPGLDGKWQQVDVDPLLGDNGRIIGSVHVVRDITDRRRIDEALRAAQEDLKKRDQLEDGLKRRQSELEQQLAMGRTALAQAHQHTQDVLAAAQEQVRLAQNEVAEQRRQKMAGLRRFAAGVAKEFEKRLAEVLGGIEITLGRLQPSQGFYNELLAVKQGLEGALYLVRQLRAFAAVELLEPQVLYVNRALRTMEPRLQRLLGKRIGPELELASGLWPVMADPLGFEEIVLNLATHVRGSTPAAGTLRLTTSAATLSEADRAADPDARPGEYVLLSVAQVSEEPALPALAYLFEPLPTASGRQGNMALTAVEGMVHQLGGFLLVAPEGTRWDVYLPALTDQPAEELAEPTAPVTPAAAPEPAEPNWPAEMAAAAAEPEAARVENTVEENAALAPAEERPTATAAESAPRVDEPGEPQPPAAATDTPAQSDAPEPLAEAVPPVEPAATPPENAPLIDPVAEADAPEAAADAEASAEDAAVPSARDDAAPSARGDAAHRELPAFLSDEEMPPAPDAEPPGGIGARLRARLRRKTVPPQDAVRLASGPVAAGRSGPASAGTSGALPSATPSTETGCRGDAASSQDAGCDKPGEPTS